MFGILQPCRHRLGDDLTATWMSHLCGMCLTLRDHEGHWARAATNVDGLVLSVLVAAQVGEAATRTAGPCALRGLRTAEVATRDDPGARLAAAVSLTAAATNVGDHVTDGDGPFARRPVAALAGRFAGAAARGGGSLGAGLGFDVGVLERAAARQQTVEGAADRGTPVTVVTAPAEEAASAAFAHTAVLAGRPANAAPLAEAGRLFGRLAHLVDAVADQADDDARGAWNPLTATGTSRAQARTLCDDALLGITLALRDVEFAPPPDAAETVRRRPRRSRRARRTAGGPADERCQHHGQADDAGAACSTGHRARGRAGDGHRSRNQHARLAHLLLVHELELAVDKAFRGAHPRPSQSGPGQSGPGQSGPGRPGPGKPAPGTPQYPGDPAGPDGPDEPRGPGRPGRGVTFASCLAATGMFCSCQMCCGNYTSPFDGQQKQGVCSGNCGDCCGSCGDCGDCCDGCSDCCDGCDGCDCGC